MTYSPINPNIFLAAYAGAVAGMGCSGRWTVDQNPKDPVGASAANLPNNVAIATVAGAWAIEFDVEFAASGLPVDCITQESVKLNSMAMWQERNPFVIPPTPTNLNPTTYATPVLSLIAIIAAEENYLAAQGISVPVCCCVET